MINLRKFTGGLFCVTCILLGGAFFLLYVPVFYCLEVRDLDNPQKSVLFDCGPKKEFIISYTHSVNKGRVKDCYSISDDGDIRLNKTIFVSYGAGIPEPEDSQTFVITENGLEIQNINRNFKTFLMAVGVEAKHAIEIDDQIYYLEKFFLPKTSLSFEYKRVSPVYFNTRLK